MPTCAHAPATTLRLADAWFASLQSRVATILDNATYTDAGCKRSNALWRGGRRCQDSGVGGNANYYQGKRIGFIGSIEAQQPRRGYARFDFLEVVHACGGPAGPSNERLLHYRGTRAPTRQGHKDGGKWLCDIANASSHSSGSEVILSLGGNNQYEFERSMAAHGPPGVPMHTYDCTVAHPRVPAALRDRLTFHQTCVGAFDGHDSAGRRFVTWRTLIKELGFPTVRLLKLDIEGHERAALWEMFASASSTTTASSSSDDGLSTALLSGRLRLIPPPRLNQSRQRGCHVCISMTTLWVGGSSYRMATFVPSNHLRLFVLLERV